MEERVYSTWQSAFIKEIGFHENAIALKEAALYERLGEWTKHLTTVAISTCESIGWRASARGHKLELLPVARSEYLALDVVAFAEGDKRWRFPTAVIELENSPQDDKVAYSLWKVLCVRADLRIVFCYKRKAEEGAELIQFLKKDVIGSMGLSGRIGLEGETVIVVGSRNESSTFPYGFFKWWKLDINAGTFRLM